MGKWYTLGAKASVFFDPTQPDTESQTVAVGDVKQLEETKLVLEWKKGGGLVQLSDAEAKELIDKNAALKKEVKAKSKADQTLEAAAKKEAEADEKLAKANLINEQAAKVLDENSKLKDRIAELEAAGLGKPNADKNTPPADNKK